MAVVTYCLERHDWSPALGSNTTILTIADWFSKAAPFVAFPNLPTALETAKILTQHVFSLHGIPQGIVSDRGAPLHFPSVEGDLLRTRGPSEFVHRFPPD